MQNLLRMLIWMAPAFILALLLILGRLDRHNAQMDVETAAFDRQFAHEEAVLSSKNDDKKFWKNEQKKAEKQLKIAEEQKIKADGKVSQQVDILEKTLKEMDEKESNQ